MRFTVWRCWQRHARNQKSRVRLLSGSTLRDLISHLKMVPAGRTLWRMCAIRIGMNFSGTKKRLMGALRFLRLHPSEKARWNLSRRLRQRVLLFQLVIRVRVPSASRRRLLPVPKCQPIWAMARMPSCRAIPIIYGNNSRQMRCGQGLFPTGFTCRQRY